MFPFFGGSGQLKKKDGAKEIGRCPNLSSEGAKEVGLCKEVVGV